MAKEKPVLEVHELYNGEVTVTLDGRHKYTVHDNGVLVPDVVNVTSISGILDKPGLKFWAANLAADHILEALRAGTDITEALIEEARRKHTTFVKEAADIGTLVHDFVETFIRLILEGKEQPALPDDERVLNGVLSFLRWRDQNNVQFVSTERIVYSREYHIVGKMDAEIKLDGKLIVADWKTSNARKPKKPDSTCSLCGKVGCGGVYNEYRYQTALYQQMANEEHAFLETPKERGVNKTITSPYEGDRLIARFDKETGNFAAHRIDDFFKDWDVARALLVARRREIEIEKS